MLSPEYRGGKNSARHREDCALSPLSRPYNEAQIRELRMLNRVLCVQHLVRTSAPGLWESSSPPGSDAPMFLSLKSSSASSAACGHGGHASR